MAIVWDQQTFQRFYGVDNLSYSRAFWERFGGVSGDPTKFWRAFYQQRLVPIFGNITGAQRILVVGCGLGLLVESIQSTGFANVWGIDSGPYMPTLWPTEVPVGTRSRLAQHDIRTVTAAQLNASLGQNSFHWIVTESVMESYAPAEQAAMYDACARFKVNQAPTSQIVHIVQPSFNGTIWPANAVDVATGEFQSWAGQPMTNQGCPARTMAEWQASRPDQTFISFEGVS